MPVQTQITEEELREAFADTMEGTSRSGIFVLYQDGKWERPVLAVPYSISNGILEIGPYFQDKFSGMPEDYHERIKKIPILDIIRYKRIELSDLIR